LHRRAWEALYLIELLVLSWINLKLSIDR
jgi:hypothetical protein